jgi:hypothetical protein
MPNWGPIKKRLDELVASQIKEAFKIQRDKLFRDKARWN